MENNKKLRQNPLFRYLSILGWLPKYERSWLRTDLIAGLTVGALLIPGGHGLCADRRDATSNCFLRSPEW